MRGQGLFCSHSQLSGWLPGHKQLRCTMLNTVVQQTSDSSGHQCVKWYNCLKVFAVASGNQERKESREYSFIQWDFIARLQSQAFFFFFTVKP